jgi:hypothetical protein
MQERIVKIAGLTPSAIVLEQTGSMGFFYGRMESAKRTVEPGKDDPNDAESNGLHQTVTFYRGTFQQKTHHDFASNGPNTEWSSHTDAEIAQTMIHEAIHLWANGFTDEFVGMVLLNKDKPVSRSVGSAEITRQVASHCPGVKKKK